MVLFKACPRCGGDMHTTRDMYGDYKGCLACGHMIDLPREVPKFTFTRLRRGRKKKSEQPAKAA